MTEHFFLIVFVQSCGNYLTDTDSFMLHVMSNFEDRIAFYGQIFANCNSVVYVKTLGI